MAKVKLTEKQQQLKRTLRPIIKNIINETISKQDLLKLDLIGQMVFNKIDELHKELIKHNISEFTDVETDLDVIISKCYNFRKQWWNFIKNDLDILSNRDREIE